MPDGPPARRTTTNPSPRRTGRGGADALAPDTDRCLRIRPDAFHESFAQDLPADGALALAVTQKAPVWHQLCERLTTETERMNPRRVVEIDASHASAAPRPQATADLTEEAVRESAR
ncbi:hypothetical protein [Streptomyces sp. NPDC093105]|uniref:hypothetical protein n=1 Tax=Streptomyces sp. NPDC093105 TaxID=3366029 RepID=UPI0037F7C2B8